MMTVNQGRDIMPSNTLNPPTVQPSPSVSRSILSRIKSPFGSKARHIPEFYIEPDNPHKHYAPGERITGSVVLTVTKPLRVTHISVCLHGYVQVYKNPNPPVDGFRAYTNAIATGKERRRAGGGYFGNGFAQLFEDEVALCGEGRLGEGTYRFNFILMFPKQKLPSSIDFERGTISYMISSTITRPTTMSPTFYADRKVSLVENIDIAPILEPRPRIISLEPVSRRIRAKGKAKKRPQPLEGSSADGEARPLEGGPVGRTSNLAEDGETPGSPAPSDISFDSGISSVGARSTIEMSQKSGSTTSSGTVNGNRNSQASKAIHATVSLDKAGFLRGDTVHVRISVSHMKRVRSRHGVIVTLYRQARVDMHPIVPVANETLSEEYYPRSKTGLGGLSLSEAGSHHLFRKDLSQSFASLIINPQTLTADVKAAVRVPEEAFPTIHGVPGQMISFKYYVEVILDLQGKLAALDRYFPNMGSSMSTSFANHSVMGRGEDANGNVFTTIGDNFVDTKEIRRDKSVVTCIFEVIVGTKDTERAKRRELAAAKVPQQQVPERATLSSNGVSESHYLGGDSNQNWSNHALPFDPNLYDGSGYGPEHEQYSQDEWETMHGFPFQSDLSTPLPNAAQGEEELSEKERLRRAEASLLPSQPPDLGESSRVAARHAPSAPAISYEDFGSSAGISALSDHHGSLTGPSAPSVNDLDLRHDPGPSAPSYESHQLPLGIRAPSDDKHEIHRRRLEEERSAPDLTQEGEDGPSVDTPRPEFTPSAPLLDDDIDGTSEVFPVRDTYLDTQLPKYER